jgi:hypothetical protein
VKAHKPFRVLLLALAGFALMLPAGVLAQRRVIAPPGLKPAAPAPKAEEPAAPAAAPAEDKAGDDQDAEAQPSSTKKKPAVAPAPQPAQQEPEKPQILLPKEELEAQQQAKAMPAVQVAAPPAREVIYRKKTEKAVVTMRVRPARPEPHRSATLVFEVVRLLTVPDPAVGFRKPLEGAVFFAELSLDGRSFGRYRLHPMKNAGTYGMHFTAPEAGIYRVALAQHLDNPEIGDVPVAADLLLGFGKETPMEAAPDEEEEDVVQVRRGRHALRSTSTKAREEPRGPLMTELGERWMALTTALAAKDAKGEELQSHAQAIAGLSARVIAEAPSDPEAAKEHGALAEGMASLAELPAKVADPAAARALMERTERDSCNRCHAKRRFHVTDDVGRWPQFEPKAAR